MATRTGAVAYARAFLRLVADRSGGVGGRGSIFVLLPGLSHEDAFRVGHTIADRITALNPKPIKLKFEKVGVPPPSAHLHASLGTNS
jgi:hypothetical protein